MAFNQSGNTAKNGFPSDQEAINHAAQMNQTLGSSATQMIFPGAQILAGSVSGNGQYLNLTSAPPTYQDRSQPFVMPVGKTSIGRITLPLLYSGKGSDIQFTLCPDNAGSPNLSAPIVSTVVPASQITNTTIQGSLTTNVPPLVTTQYNAVSLQNLFAFTWSQPAVGAGGAAQYATPTTNGDYMILSGGYTGSAAAGTVVTVQTLGGGFISNPQAQPSLPQPAWYHMMAATDTTIVVAGGTNGTSYYSNVWSANWDPNTGTIGAWTAQTSLPVPVVQGCGAAWGDYVYFTGGNADLTPANSYNTVYYANATNGQIQSWNTASAMPVNLQVHFCAAINGWLVIAGGQNSAGATQNHTYYAKINSDGSLDTWNRGPDMPVGVYAFGAQWSFGWSEDALIVLNGLISSGTATNQCQILPIGTNSIGTWWAQTTTLQGVYQVAVFPHGEDGNWQMNIISNTNYFAADTLVVPMVSVPLPATGLTPGNTYHLVIHPMNETLSDYTQFYVGPSANLSAYVLRTRYTNNAWVPLGVGWAFPITVYDNSTGTQLPIHTWQNQNSNFFNQATKTSTFVNDWQAKILGYCEAETQPIDPMNLNTLTTNSVAPWTATNGTITASNAQTHGGFSFSGLLTPNGSSATVTAQSEAITVTAGKAYVFNSWLYMTSSSSSVSLSINWYDPAGTLISTSSNVQSIGAATWTYFTNQAVAPSTAATARMVPTLGGTPPAGNPLYLSYAQMTLVDPTVASSVAQLNYSTTSPGAPTGVTQLN